MQPPTLRSNQKRLPPPFGKLSAQARLLIGLRKYSDASDARIRRIMGMRQREIDRFWYQIRKDKHGREILKNGLPAMFGEPLPDDMAVRCNRCESLLTWVPCVVCCNADIVLPAEDTEMTEPPASPHATSELPGTRGKMTIMQYRIRMGWRIFHDGDALIED